MGGCHFAARVLGPPGVGRNGGARDVPAEVFVIRVFDGTGAAFGVDAFDLLGMVGQGAGVVGGMEGVWKRPSASSGSTFQSLEYSPSDRGWQTRLPFLHGPRGRFARCDGHNSPSRRGGHS